MKDTLSSTLDGLAPLAPMIPLSPTTSNCNKRHATDITASSLNSCSYYSYSHSSNTTTTTTTTTTPTLSNVEFRGLGDATCDRVAYDSPRKRARLLSHRTSSVASTDASLRRPDRDLLHAMVVQHGWRLMGTDEWELPCEKRFSSSSITNHESSDSENNVPDSGAVSRPRPLLRLPTTSSSTSNTVHVRRLRESTLTLILYVVTHAGHTQNSSVETRDVRNTAAEPQHMLLPKIQLQWPHRNLDACPTLDAVTDDGRTVALEDDGGRWKEGAIRAWATSGVAGTPSCRRLAHLCAWLVAHLPNHKHINSSTNNDMVLEDGGDGGVPRSTPLPHNVSSGMSSVSPSSTSCEYGSYWDIPCSRFERDCRAVKVPAKQIATSPLAPGRFNVGYECHSRSMFISTSVSSTTTEYDHRDVDIDCDNDDDMQCDEDA